MKKRSKAFEEGYQYMYMIGRDDTKEINKYFKSVGLSKKDIDSCDYFEYYTYNPGDTKKEIKDFAEGKVLAEQEMKLFNDKLYDIQEIFDQYKGCGFEGDFETWKEMLGGAQFYILWIMYFIGASAGLTFISVAQDLGKKSLGELAFLAVAVLSVGNAGGRILAGIISDKIGRQWTLFICFLFQAVVIASLYYLQGGSGWMLTMLIVLFIGANYGANLSIFPSVSKDYFGLKSYGLNYGILFTAWGAGGLIMPRINGMILDATGSNGLTFAIIVCMLLVGAVLTFVSRSIASREKA